MTSIITEYPIWFIIFCLGLGFLYAWLFYRKDKKFEEVSSTVIRTMFSLRFIVVSIISFLLLSPVLKSFGKTIEDPLIIYAQDNSESLYSKKELSENNYFRFQEIMNASDKPFLLKTFTFGENSHQNDSFSFTEKQTDIANIISEIKNRYYHRNIGALILASDGIYNKGNNPEYEVENVTFPVYTIALGDTSIKKDIILSNIKYNKTAFLNNTYPVQVVVRANKLKGEKTKLKIYESGKVIYQKDIVINENDFYKKVNLDLNAGRKGFHKLKIVLEKSDQETNTLNNSKLIIIEVVDSKQKILILANSPHPDISAIRQSLELNQNYETEFFLARQFNKSVVGYNMVILHQLPARNNSTTEILSKILNTGIPVFYVLGNQSSLQKFDNLNIGLTTGAYTNVGDEVQGRLNLNFDLFELSPEINEITLNAPPILSRFGDYNFSSNSQILFYRKVRNIDTHQPLLIFLKNASGHKSAVLTGEGIWRWRLFDYQNNKNHYLFNELINNSIQYLTSREIKERLKVINDRIFPENQNVVFKAEVYDRDYNLTVKPDVTLKVTDSLNSTQEFSFTITGKSYVLHLKKYSPGDYRWNAETIIDGKRYKKSGIFSVLPNTVESENLTAKHNILYKLSEKTNGKLFYPNDTESLAESIINDDNIVPIAFSEKKTEDLINFKILFFFILFLLTAEWFMRKFFGAY